MNVVALFSFDIYHLSSILLPEVGSAIYYHNSGNAKSISNAKCFFTDATLVEMLIPLRNNEYDTVEANRNFFYGEKSTVEGLRKSERCAKHTFALEMVHNRTGTCHKNLRVTLSIIVMYRIMFRICSWDADVVWARRR